MDESDSKFAEANAARLKALDINVQVLGENHPKVAGQYFNVGNSFQELGEIKEAITYFGKAVDIGERVMPDNSVNLLIFRTMLAYCETRERQFDESDKVVAAMMSAVARNPKLDQYDVVQVDRLTGVMNAFGKTPNETNRKRVDDQIVVARNAAESASTRELVDRFEKIRDSWVTK